jgi:gamma-glutamyltranspeptidase / glutathione hydrolase
MEGEQTWTVTKPAVRGRDGLVAAQHLGAARVGAQVLRGGGNAVDAAIATSFAMGVLEPWMSGLGGGGFMVIAPGDGSPPSVIDFGMVAPAALDPAAYPLAGGRDADLFGWPAVASERNVHGALAIAAPTYIAGIELAWRTSASRPWADLLAPAIALAEAGLPVNWHVTLRIAGSARDLARYPAAREVFLPDGAPALPEGGPRPLGPLAGTLRRLAEAGARDLMEGELARALVADVQAAGGVLALDDLAGYQARRVAPLDIVHRDAVVHAPPGLSAGPTLAHAFELIAGQVGEGAPGPEAYLAWAAALQAAYEHRLATLGDVDDRRDPASTTHLVAVDRDGTTVSLTQTLLSLFGSKILSPSTGILLNNGIMWFDPRRGRPNSIAPAKRPLANMCPVVASRAGRPWLAIGGSGGRRIMPAVLQIASMLIDGDLDLETAFHLPRIDVSGEPLVTADRRLPPAVLDALAARHQVLLAEPVPHPNHFACPTAVLREGGGSQVGMTDVIHPLAGAAAA